jgi:hypothetical protein
LRVSSFNDSFDQFGVEFPRPQQALANLEVWMAQRLPVTGSRTLGRDWMKFRHIMRLGKVVREVERSPVQQLEVMFEPDLWKKLDSRQAREALTKVCTDGAPSCTMRLKTPEGTDVQRIGPLFQLTTTVLAPGGKGQTSESRNVCFFEGVALLEKQLPRESQVIENGRFLAFTRRHNINFRDADAPAEARAEARIVALQQTTLDASQHVKASAFRWQGRGALAASVETPAAPHPPHPTPAAFKWCDRGSVATLLMPLAAATTSSACSSATSTAGRKRGREETDDHMPTQHEREKRRNTIAIAQIRIS